MADPPLDSMTHRVRECVCELRESRSAALASLFDLTAQRLLRLSVAITRNQHDAEDAVQAVLASVAGAPEGLRRAQEPWHYLLRMVRNRSLQILRGKQRSVCHASLEDLHTYAAWTNWRWPKIIAVWRAAWLPPEQSEIVVLKIWEELTFPQIGQILRDSSGHGRQSLSLRPTEAG